MTIIDWREFTDSDRYMQVSWHNTKAAAEKRAHKVGASLVVHYPETSIKQECWVVVKPR